MFSRRTTSTSAAPSRSVSRAGSVTENAAEPSSGPQVVRVNYTNHRTLSLEDECDDVDVPVSTSLQKQQYQTGPMSTDLDTEPASEGPDSSTEVKTLVISNMDKSCTMADIYEAFQTAKEEMRIEFKSNELALLHFPDADRAMKAYFIYLQSTNSLGTVSPFEPSGASESSSSSPTRDPNVPSLRSRRSFIQSNVSSNRLMNLSNLSTWRSSDKLSSANNTPKDDKFRLGHRSNSSRSSVNLKALDSRLTMSTQIAQPLSTQTSPSMLNAISPKIEASAVPLDANNKAATTHLESVTRDQNTGTSDQVLHPEALATQKTSSSAKKFFSHGLGFKMPSRVVKEVTKVKPAQPAAKSTRT